MIHRNLPIIKGTIIGAILGVFVYGPIAFLSIAHILDIGFGEKTGVFNQILGIIASIIVFPLRPFLNTSISFIIGTMLTGIIIGIVSGLIYRNKKL